MVLKSLDRLSRSKSPATAPAAEPARNPPLPVRQEKALASGKWLNWFHIQGCRLSIDDVMERWLAHPDNIAAAADWNIDPAEQHLLIYRRFAPHAWAKGWNPLMETPDRVPGMYEGAPWALDKNGKRRWMSTKPSLFWDVKRTPMDIWTEVDGSSSRFNVAMTNGLLTCTVVVDMDIRDQEFVEQVHAIADEALGKTEFVRVNTWPKRQLVFRMSPEEFVATQTMSFEFFGADGGLDQIEETRDDKTRMVPRNALELLGYKHNWTAYGRGKKGNAISWALGKLHPAVAGPEEAPLITQRMLKVFFERVYEVRRFKQSGSSSSSPFGAPVNEVTAFERADDQRIWKPGVSTGVWTVDETGIVTDGREPFATHMAWSFCAANSHLLLNDADADAVRQTYLKFITDKCLHGLVKKMPAARAGKPKFDAARAKWVASAKAFAETGEHHTGMVPYRLLDDGSRPCSQHIPAVARPADGSLDWLPESGGIVPELGGRSKISNIIVRTKTKDQIQLDKKCRALIDGTADREAIHARVAAEIDAAYGKMLAEVLQREEHTPSPDEIVPTLPLHILGAPTGSGKTTRGIRSIGAWCKENPRKVGGKDFGPIVIAVPTGENLEEALRTAERSGMVVPKPEMDIDQIAAELSANGVKVAVIRGKRVAGCKRIEEVEMLAKRGMSSARLGKKAHR